MPNADIFFPINQSEQAKQASRDSLLARDVFKKIADLLKISVEKLSANECVELDDHRAHEAILIDGGRGTGKSSVLVNLKLYMDGEPELNNKLLILKPVDPTLLENGDDLFLNIIVAALIRNKEIKTALNKGDKKAEAFYEQLQKLGSALEGVQTQKTQYGLDKLRAFIGNHGIAEEVHALFHNALQLTGKTLIVLPIDDVDTSLQHAFENMEVVRKYLASPYVIPIISGDLDLYHDATWRDFYGRIVKDHRTEVTAAKVRSQSLANEYQRKVLPLPRRIDVPGINDYFNNPKINIVNRKNKTILSFLEFKHWLDALLNERVNGGENSRLDLPIHSIREFAQLITSTESGLSELAKFFPRESQSKESNVLLSALIKLENKDAPPPSLLSNYIAWFNLLEKHFLMHDKGGVVYLVMNANRFWRDPKKITLSILDIDLFKPLLQSEKRYAHFDKVEGLRDAWTIHLDKLIRDSKWKRNLPAATILPYPLPEIGVRGEPKLSRSVKVANNKSKDSPLVFAELIRQLMVHHSFYSKSNNGNLILTGRLFEILILSLMQEVTGPHILAILDRAPFYSSASIASTKTFNFDQVEDDDIDENENSEKPQSSLDIKDEIDQLVEDINNWRKENISLLKVKPHAWLIYNVMNKYFNQVSIDDSWILSKKGYPSNLNLRFATDVAIRSFDAICAVFGSFEKGALFNHSDKIANINGSAADRNFEQNQLFLQNILPFLNSQKSSSENGSEAKWQAIPYAYTGHLYTHPLKKILIDVFNSFEKQPNQTPIDLSRDKRTQATEAELKVAESIAHSVLKNIFTEIPSKQWINENLNNRDPRVENALIEFKKRSKFDLTKLDISLNNYHGKKRFINLRRMFDIDLINIL